MQKSDPAQDDELKILMIGNSFCYYYVEELCGMLSAAGYKNVNVCNVYYSGCTLQQHYIWWKSGNANYEYFTTNNAGRNSVKSVNLEHCLKTQLGYYQPAGSRCQGTGKRRKLSFAYRDLSDSAVGLY